MCRYWTRKRRHVAVWAQLRGREDGSFKRERELYHELVLRISQEPHVLQPALVDLPHDILLKHGTHHRDELLVRVSDQQVPCLVEVLAQFDTHFWRDALFRHE